MWPLGLLQSGSRPHPLLDEAQSLACLTTPVHPSPVLFLLHPTSVLPPRATEALATGLSPRHRKPCGPQVALLPLPRPDPTAVLPGKPGPPLPGGSTCHTVSSLSLSGQPWSELLPQATGRVRHPAHRPRQQGPGLPRAAPGTGRQPLSWGKPSQMPVNHQMGQRQSTPKATKCSENRDFHPSVTPRI